MKAVNRFACGLTTFFLLVAMTVISTAQADDRLRVVATFSIIGDFVAEVAGDTVALHVLTPPGAEVHEYELRPRDFMALERGDLVFANGYDLEQWMGQLEATVRSGTEIVHLAEASGAETLPIAIGEFEGVPDPHLWMDPSIAVGYVEAIADALAERLPDDAEAIRANADVYIEQLETLEREMREELEAVPEERRVLITSEAAFLYFARAFDFDHDGIWGTNAESEGTPSQIMRILDVIAERQPSAVFWESTISSRYVEGVAEDTGVEVAGPLYVDSVGDAESDADTYLRMMRRNAATIRNALGDD
ncbi:zinc ABC transporter substrate-binding protein [Methylonatrum kenyense]|uniref:metal ABC transporter solute-binding protein, Zn/Mn family n=1 Tax=Methylonatrum kenyense TaxID=455253 RepID=UPI0020C08CF1|nr:zinc ABC transporter substrate-binding protein [Methylonatrum kenyense]MCK8514785.1 zinc ABC transporter substrate-binding protein [Methylonatrum kenyense]